MIKWTAAEFGLAALVSWVFLLFMLANCHLLMAYWTLEWEWEPLLVVMTFYSFTNGYSVAVWTWVGKLSLSFSVYLSVMWVYTGTFGLPSWQCGKWPRSVPPRSEVCRMWNGRNENYQLQVWGHVSQPEKGGVTTFGSGRSMHIL